jgi:hypothetical protein
VSSADRSRDREVDRHLTEQELDAMLASLPPLTMPEESWQRIDSALAALPPLEGAVAAEESVNAVPAAEEGRSTVVPLRPRHWYDSAGARLAVAAAATLFAVGLLGSLGATEPEPTVPVVAAPSLLTDPSTEADSPSGPTAGSQSDSGRHGSAPDADEATEPPETTSRSAAPSPAATPTRVRQVRPGPTAVPLAVLSGSGEVDAGVAGGETWTVTGPVQSGTVLAQDGMTLSFGTATGDPSDPELTATTATLTHPPAVRVVRVLVSDGSTAAVYAEDGDGTLTAMAAGDQGTPETALQTVTVFYELEL